VDVLRRGADVLIVAVGAMSRVALDVADRLAAQGISATVIDPRWIAPVPPELAALASTHRLVVTIEDNGRAGGAGATFSQALRDADVDVPTRDIGIPQRFLEHGSRAEVHAEIGLTAQDISRTMVELVARLERDLETAQTSLRKDA